MSLLIWAWNNWLKRMNRHPSLLPAMWLNWSNCSLDSIYRPLVNIWNVSIRLHFILSALCWSSSQNYGNTKGQAFGLFVPNGCIWGPCGPACPLLLCDCVIRCDTKTSLSSSLCQPAALHWKSALTAMTLQPDWTSDPLTCSHRDGAQTHHYYMQTSGLL